MALVLAACGETTNHDLQRSIRFRIPELITWKRGKGKPRSVQNPQRIANFRIVLFLDSLDFRVVGSATTSIGLFAEVRDPFQDC